MSDNNPIKSWHSKDSENILEELNSSMEGLTDEDVERNLEKYGYNELEEPPKTSKIIKFLNQFNNPLIFLTLCLICSDILLFDNISLYNFIVLLSSFSRIDKRNKISE